MDEGFLQRLKTWNPHFRGGKSVHPHDEANTGTRVICLKTESADRFGRCQHRLCDNFDRSAWQIGQTARDFLRVTANFLERFLTVEVLASGDEPNFQLAKID